jgi:hypothetical protein
MSLKAFLLQPQERESILLEKTEEAHYKNLNKLKLIKNPNERITAIHLLMKNTVKTLSDDEAIIQKEWQKLITELDNVCKFQFWLKETGICKEALIDKPCLSPKSCSFCQQNVIIEEKIAMVQYILDEEKKKEKRRPMPQGGQINFPILGR